MPSEWKRSLMFLGGWTVCVRGGFYSAGEPPEACIKIYSEERDGAIVSQTFVTKDEWEVFKAEVEKALNAPE